MNSSLYGPSVLRTLPILGPELPGNRSDYPDVFIIDPTTPPQVRVDMMYDIICQDAHRADLRSLAHQIAAGKRGDFEVLQSLLDWQARNVRYQEDPTDDDGWQLELVKRPAVAIVDGEDDCEGKVCVFDTLAMALGYPAIDVWIEQKESRNNHVAGRVCVPQDEATRALPVPRFDVEVIEPTDKPRVIDGVWLWVETTLGDVKTRRGVVPGPRVSEHPYVVLARFRAAGVARLSL